jgi:hypothetical protein
MRQAQDLAASIDWPAAIADGTAGRCGLACIRYARAAQEEWRKMREACDRVRDARDGIELVLYVEGLIPSLDRT